MTDKIAILIKKISLEFEKMSNPLLDEYDLTVSQYRVLKYLYTQKNETARIMDIEKECSITHPTVIGLLDNLSKKGFVVKIINPEDKRSKVISLTDKSKKVQKELNEVGDKLESMLTEGLNNDEKQQLITLLKKLLKTTEER